MGELKTKYEHFNQVLYSYNKQFPKEQWTTAFKEDLLTNFSFWANKLEGNQASYGDTISFIQKGYLGTGKGVSDILQIANYKEILNKLFETYDQFQLSVENILSIHKQLMDDPLQWGNVVDAYNVAGKFRVDERFGMRENTYKEYLNPAAIPKAMESLITETNAEMKLADMNSTEHHPISIISRFHNRFLNEIHPFRDGNGRVFRFLQGVLYLKFNIPPFLPEDRTEYLNTIIQSEEEESFEAVAFCFMGAVLKGIKSGRGIV